MKVRRITSEHILTIKTGDERRASEMISFLIGFAIGGVIGIISMAMAVAATDKKE